MLLHMEMLPVKPEQDCSYQGKALNVQTDLQNFNKIRIDKTMI